MRGTWLLRGTGKLLAITPAGEYSVDEFGDASEPETGAVTVKGAGSVVFTPQASPSCTAVYESVTSRNTTLDATVASGSCGRLAGTTDTWIRLN